MHIMSDWWKKMNITLKAKKEKKYYTRNYKFKFYKFELGLKVSITINF